jgi:hypothetical protein
LLKRVERRMQRDYPDALREWQEKEALAKASRSAWLEQVAKCAKDGMEPPPLPEEAEVPPKPVLPRAMVGDVTPERLQIMLAGLPKGAWSAHDELKTWTNTHVRYNGDCTSFWLSSTSGSEWTVDRVKQGEMPIRIPHLCMSVFGTIQPDRVAELLDRADDGLMSRFLWFWPAATAGFDATPPNNLAAAAEERLNRLCQRSRQSAHLAGDTAAG